MTDDLRLRVVRLDARSGERLHDRTNLARDTNV